MKLTKSKLREIIREVMTETEKNILMSVKNIKKTYATNKENTYALEHVSLDI